MKAYRHLFFDLDHTLWDFDKNAEETLYQLYGEYKLKELGISSPDAFIENYTRNNHKLWAQYHTGIITKDELRHQRFRITFTEMGLNPNDIPKNFEEDYVRICPTKTNLFPGVHETLSYLQTDYILHLITNGFKESTEVKVNNSNISHYFSEIIISEDVGHNKPSPLIFDYAIKRANTQITQSLMIGDSLEADMTGALNVGMHCCFFNPYKVTHQYPVNYEIHQLNQLTEFL